MVELYIDPFVLACPSPFDGPKAVDEYVQALLACRGGLNIAWLAMYKPTATFEVLTEADYYPSKKLAGVLASLDPPYIQAADISKIVSRLLDPPYVEDHLGISNVAIGTADCSPSQHLSGRTPPFVEQYQRLLTLMALAARLSQIDTRDWLILTRGLPRGTRTALAIDANVQNYQANACGTAPGLPMQVSGSFGGCCCMDDLCLLVDPVDLWLLGSGERSHCQWAITLSAFQYGWQEGHRIGIADQPQWSLHSALAESAKDLGFIADGDKARRLLRACAETILGINMQATHELRVGKGGNDPQRTRSRDKAKAWRRDIDREYHLHYWETGYGPELAKVVQHKDNSIPE